MVVFIITQVKTQFVHYKSVIQSNISFSTKKFHKYKIKRNRETQNFYKYIYFVCLAPFAIQILNPQVKRAGKKGQISHAFFNFMLHFHFLSYD